MLLPELTHSQSVAFGVFLILLGCSFCYKGYQALINGRLLLWHGFFPFTLISPFVNHLPPGKNSLLKYKEAMWIHVIMGPLFFLIATLSIAAGFDYAGFPGTDTLNSAFTGGKAVAPAITFSPRAGYTFPIVPRTVAVLSKFFSGQLGLSRKDQLYEEHTGQSYQDAISH